MLISIFIIYSVHFLWNFLKDNFTTKKTKDLVSIQAEKYKKIVEEIQKTKGSPLTPFENEQERQEMENDLSHFLEEITMSPSPTTTTNQ
jgi:hypothetical protein